VGDSDSGRFGELVDGIGILVDVIVGSVVIGDKDGMGLRVRKSV
jgi:hypothetical protein